MGDDVFVLHGGISSLGSFVAGDESKQDMNDRLENLLTRESIDVQ